MSDSSLFNLIQSHGSIISYKINVKTTSFLVTLLTLPYTIKLANMQTVFVVFVKVKTRRTIHNGLLRTETYEGKWILLKGGVDCKRRLQ